MTEITVREFHDTVMLKIGNYAFQIVVPDAVDNATTVDLLERKLAEAKKEMLMDVAAFIRSESPGYDSEGSKALSSVAWLIEGLAEDDAF